MAKKRVKKSKKKVVLKKPKKEKLGKEVGKVTHYFDKISVAVVKLKAPLKKGAKIRVKGNTTDFSQKVESIQYDHQTLATGKKGQEIGMKVKDRVRDNDKVYVA